MAYTLTEVQATLTLLKASYNELAAAPIHTYSLNQRNIAKHRMKEIREEIQAWEEREAELLVVTTGESTSVVYAQFEKPA